MNVIVYDYKRNEIKVGTKVIYGSSNNVAVVTAISDPDVVCDEDEWGREYAHRIEVDISIRFDDGSTDKLRARSITNSYAAVMAAEAGIEIDEEFEESGDLEVIV